MSRLARGILTLPLFRNVAAVAAGGIIFMMIGSGQVAAAPPKRPAVHPPAEPAAHRDFEANPEFLRVVAQAQANDAKKKSDQYADVHDPAPGVPFKVTLGFSSQFGSSRSIYEDGVLHLSLAPTPGGYDGIFKGYPYALTFGRKTVDSSSYIGSNAFGATARVDRFHDVEIGMYLVNQPHHYMIAGREEKSSSMAYQVDIPATGLEAKLLVSNAEFIIEGLTTTLHDGKTVFCSSDYSGATINTPVAMHTDRCLVAADVQRITLIDKASGRILKAWDHPIDVTLGHSDRGFLYNSVVEIGPHVDKP